MLYAMFAYDAIKHAFLLEAVHKGQLMTRLREIPDLPNEAVLNFESFEQWVWSLPEPSGVFYTLEELTRFAELDEEGRKRYCWAKRTILAYSQTKEKVTQEACILAFAKAR